MRWLPKDIGGFFYDNIDMNGLLYWFEVVKHKIDEKVKFNDLLLKGLGYKQK